MGFVQLGNGVTIYALANLANKTYSGTSYSPITTGSYINETSSGFYAKETGYYAYFSEQAPSNSFASKQISANGKIGDLPTTMGYHTYAMYLGS